MAKRNPNISGNAYALTILAPIKNGYTEEQIAYADIVRCRLQDWNNQDYSPMAQVPQTYLCRYYVLDDVYTESLPGADPRSRWLDLLTALPFGGIGNKLRVGMLPKEDHLQSRYLVFSCNFHGGPEGDLDGYLRGMWQAISEQIKDIWGFCYGFEEVDNADKFIAYMKQCQRPAALFFVGSNDDPLPEQLKALYLKQEFANFAVANQGLDAAALRANFKTFIERVQPNDVTGPTWPAGKYTV